jgi:hypothetical protein
MSTFVPSAELDVGARQKLPSIGFHRPSIGFYRGAIAHSIGPAIGLPSVPSPYLLSPHTPLATYAALWLRSGGLRPR